MKAATWTPPANEPTSSESDSGEATLSEADKPAPARPIVTNPIAGARLDILAFPPGPITETYADEKGAVLTRQISGVHAARGWWADSDTTRTLILSRSEDGTRAHFLTADGRSGPVEYAFDPPLVVMPAQLDGGEPFEHRGAIRYGAPDAPSSAWDDGIATSTAELLDDGRVRSTLVLKTGRSSVTRTTTRTLSETGVVREERSLRVVAFGMTVRKSERVLERAGPR